MSPVVDIAYFRHDLARTTASTLPKSSNARFLLYTNPSSPRRAANKRCIINPTGEVGAREFVRQWVAKFHDSINQARGIRVFPTRNYNDRDFQSEGIANLNNTEAHCQIELTV